MKMNRIFNILTVAVLAVAFAGCDKFLDTMPDNRAEVDSQSKIQALLTSAYPENTYLYFLEYMSDNVDNIGDDNPGTDRYTDQIYKWEQVTETSNDDPKGFWSGAYGAIAHANQALYAISEIAGSLDEEAVVAAGLEAEMAEALLARAYNHFMLVNVFCKNYNAQKSRTDMGVPYMEDVERELNPRYERGNVADVYEKIERDLKLGLKYVSDKYYRVPKYHFNTRAAYAFACRFYLYYEKWEKAIEYANKCLGSQPSQVLRDWKRMSSLERDWEVRSNDFILSSHDANLLLATSYTGYGYDILYGIRKYSHDSYLTFYELSFAKNVWGNANAGFQAVNSWFYCPVAWYNGTNLDQCATWKLPYLFEYTDPVARIGYAHTVAPLFTMDETLLNRAEAYVMTNDYDLAAADINTFIRTIIKENNFKNDLSAEDIVNFYKDIPYATWDNSTIKKKLNPAFEQGIGQDGGAKESMLQCVLGMKRIDELDLGLRWFDVKRYGIEIWRRTMQNDEKAGQYDAALKPLRLDDVLTVDDERRAMQLPQDVINAGLPANPRKGSGSSGAVAVPEGGITRDQLLIKSGLSTDRRVADPKFAFVADPKVNQ
ncbi:MAG: RagB/SusD family nutrient uptake outer membrane protein [Bacteroidales bacterium]|nr:RagB/SusD family nutrient uptake outer membrane protein [Bacteroidales bacterium]